jgi:hypothetical protein
MRAHEIITENIDNVDGWGAVPFNQEIDYRGLRVMMRPSVFLSLAASLSNPQSVGNIQKHLQSGGTIGAPFLTVSIPDEWSEGDFSTPAQIIGHDGRNRMIALRNINGDEPVEVHVFPQGLRRRHLTDDMIKTLNRGARKEESSGVVAGPLFAKILK